MQILDREIATELTDMAKHYPIVTLLGPRQSGKTTLVKKHFPEKAYVSLENLDERDFAQSDPRGFLNRFPNGAILDEIQREPTLLSYLQEIVDKADINGLFILTGSHQLELHASITQSLAGRTAMLKLLPLTLAELSQHAPPLSLDEYLLHGMYPRIYKNNLNPTKFYRDYVQTYIERDVRKMINLKDLGLFQKFLKLCAGRTGQIFNRQNLSNELGISNNTVSHWLSVLEASFLVFTLPPYFENFGKRLIKSPKLYFTDVGLATYLLDIYTAEQLTRDPLRGQLVENLVISEFLKNQFNRGLESGLYFYRDSNQNEVDLLFKSGHNLIPIEIKSSTTFNRDFLKGLKYFHSIAPDRMPFGMVIYAGEQEQKIDYTHIFNYKSMKKISALLATA
jgi:predicted AAA+ superfamily ATPase